MGNGLEARKNMCIHKIMRYHMAVNKSKGRNIEAGVLQATPNFCEAVLGSQTITAGGEVACPKVWICSKNWGLHRHHTKALRHAKLLQASIASFQSQSFQVSKRSYHGLHQFLSLPVHFFLCCSRPTENRTGPNLLPIRELVNFSETLKKYSKNTSHSLHTSNQAESMAPLARQSRETWELPPTSLGSWYKHCLETEGS